MSSTDLLGIQTDRLAWPVRTYVRFESRELISQTDQTPPASLSYINMLLLTHQYHTCAIHEPCWCKGCAMSPIGSPSGVRGFSIPVSLPYPQMDRPRCTDRAQVGISIRPGSRTNVGERSLVSRPAGRRTAWMGLCLRAKMTARPTWRVSAACSSSMSMRSEPRPYICGLAKTQIIARCNLDVHCYTHALVRCAALIHHTIEALGISWSSTLSLLEEDDYSGLPPQLLPSSRRCTSLHSCQSTQVCQHERPTILNEGGAIAASTCTRRTAEVGATK